MVEILDIDSFWLLTDRGSLLDKKLIKQDKLQKMFNILIFAPTLGFVEKGDFHM
jgi:hypothetical protein